MNEVLKNSKKLKLISILLIAVLLMSLLPLVSFGENSNAKNITGDVNISNPKIDVYTVKPPIYMEKRLANIY